MLLFNLFIKYFIIYNLITLTIIPLFTHDLLIIWFIMEINNFMFICYMSMEMNLKKNIFLFYMIQVLASLLLIFPLIINNFFFFNNQNILIFNFYLSLILKLGIPPFHMWMIYLSSYMPWKILFIFLTFQKIIPFYMFSLIEINLQIFLFMILLSSYIPIFKMINLLNFKILLTYSSINQSSWMLLLIFFKNLFWLIYMFIYSIILMIISFYFNYFKFSFNFYIYFFNKMNFNFLSIFLMFNLASIPPLSFFLMKWFSIYIFMFNSKMFLIFILMMINSFILIYIYLNLLSLMMFFFTMKIKFNLININNNDNKKKIIFKNMYLIMFFSFFSSLYFIIL
uniref:NADH-ubiquinone oxidoreductase chain 2 n=1 Tax=Nylanderia flavipes TaxID=67766 RepID=A0A6B9BK29_9HYME|nr:NADH dehydrogenase subunit 2 [Nylanderia flavipes]QGW36354.1 NADH dehydrogenase subunit 2 [Nylanderia flavipes]